jgi:AcrR family transcriptional regulator
MPRPRAHDRALRARLLATARETLATRGAAALSLRTLAGECATSTTAVYSLFGGKRGLLTAIFDDAFERLGRRLAEVAAGADPVADLVRLAAAYRHAALDEPHLFAVMFDGQTVLPQAAEARTAAGTALGPLRAGVARAVEQGALRPDTHPETASVTLWATVHGWVALQLRGFLPPGADSYFEDAVYAVLDGWRTPAPTG